MIKFGIFIIDDIIEHLGKYLEKVFIDELYKILIYYL